MSGFSRFVTQMGLLMIVALAVVFVPALAAGGNAGPSQAATVQLQR